MTATTTLPALEEIEDRFPDGAPIPGFTIEEMYAIDRGAVRAYWKIGPTYVHEHWQAEGLDPAAAVRSRAYGYAYEHAEMIHQREAWEIASHICDRMTEAMARANKPRKDGKGREVRVMAWGVWEELEQNVIASGHTRPTVRRWTGTESTLSAPEIDPNGGADFPLLDARTRRKIGGKMLEQLRMRLDPGTPRPHTPSDPAGEIATRRAYSAFVWETLADLDLLETIDQQPASDTRDRRPSRHEYWHEVLDGRGRRSWCGRIRKSTGLSDPTVAAYVEEIAPVVSERIGVETKRLDEPTFKAAVPEIIRDETRRALEQAFRAGICDCRECVS